MQKIFFSILFLILSECLYAQGSESIQTDRPDQTESPFVTPKNQLQMEIGFVYEEESSDISNFTMPNILTKYGLSDRVELRLITEYAGSVMQTSDVVVTKKYVTPTLVGCKVNFFEEKKYLPQTSLILHVGLPFFSSKEFKSNNVFTTFRFLMQHTLRKNVSFSYNLGMEWDGISVQPNGIYTIAFGYGISSKVGSYLELYGNTNGRQMVHQYDMGFTYLINKDLQLDISGGFGLTSSAPNYFIGCGVSFRTSK